jgi:hypothetical protein
MSKSCEEMCRALAGYVLSGERGLNTPTHRQVLATSLEKVIGDYIAFEKEKLRYGRSD